MRKKDFRSSCPYFKLMAIGILVDVSTLSRTRLTVAFDSLFSVQYIFFTFQFSSKTFAGLQVDFL